MMMNGLSVIYSASARSLSVSKASAISSVRRISRTLTSMPSAPAAAWTSPNLQHIFGCDTAGHDCQAAQSGDEFAQQPNSFAGDFGHLISHAGDITARPRETSDQASAERLFDKRDDWDDGCRPFGLKSIGIRECMDHLHLELNELSQECSGGFRTSIFPAQLDP